VNPPTVSFAYIKNNKNSGDISALSNGVSYAGGIVGLALGETTIIANFSIGDVVINGFGTQRRGGVAGGLGAEVVVRNSFYLQNGIVSTVGAFGRNDGAEVANISSFGNDGLLINLLNIALASNLNNWVALNPSVGGIAFRNWTTDIFPTFA